LAHRIRKPHAISGIEDIKVRSSEIDSFISGVRLKRPANYHSVDAVLLSIEKSKSPGAFAYIIPLERELIIICSLAAKKQELSAFSPSGYEPWESAFYVWQSEGYQRALEARLLLADSAEDAIRRLPRSERFDFVKKYNAYMNWLKQMTGNDNDQIPVNVLLDSISTYEFPEVPKPV